MIAAIRAANCIVIKETRAAAAVKRRASSFLLPPQFWNTDACSSSVGDRIDVAAGDSSTSRYCNIRYVVRT